VSVIRETQVQQAGLVGRSNGALGGGIVALGLGRSLCKSSEHLFITPRNELGITKALIVACVAEKLGRVLEESSEIGFTYASLRCEALPVTS
jgi:hypothetical protein